LGLFSRIIGKMTAGPELSDAQLYEGAVARPALAFNNTRGGPNYLRFDAVEIIDGVPLLTLDLQGASLDQDGEIRFLSALDALDQNIGVRCQIVLLESDYEAFEGLLNEAQVSHRSALSRIQLLVGKDA
jgi:hypothetical protein